MNVVEFLFAGVQSPAKTAGRDLRAQRLHAQDLTLKTCTPDLLHPHDAQHQD
jgi:hypothetical protein